MKMTILTTVGGAVLAFTAVPAVACTLEGDDRSISLDQPSVSGELFPAASVVEAYAAALVRRPEFSGTDCTADQVEAALLTENGWTAEEEVPRTAMMRLVLPAEPEVSPSPPEAVAEEVVQPTTEVPSQPAVETVVREVPARVNLGGIRSDIAALQDFRRKLESTPQQELSPEQAALLTDLAGIDNLVETLRNLPATGVVQTATLTAEQQAALQQLTEWSAEQNRIQQLEDENFVQWLAMVALLALMGAGFTWLAKTKATRNEVEDGFARVERQFEAVDAGLEIDSNILEGIKQMSEGQTGVCQFLISGEMHAVDVTRLEKDCVAFNTRVGGVEIGTPVSIRKLQSTLRKAFRDYSESFDRFKAA